MKDSIVILMIMLVLEEVVSTVAYFGNPWVAFATFIVLIVALPILAVDTMQQFGWEK